MPNSEYYADLLKQLSDSEARDDDNVDSLREILCNKNTETLSNDLNSCDLNDKHKLELMCKLVAEMAKNQTCRESLVEADYLTLLNKYINRGAVGVDTQVCRAIGNLCYDNDNGRLVYLNSNGPKQIVDLMKSLTDLDVEFVKSSNEHQQLITVALGCLHNITNECDTLRETFYELNVANYLKLITKNHIKMANCSIIRFLFICLENLLCLDQFKESFENEKFVYYIYDSFNKEILLSLNDNYEDLFSFFDTINSLKSSKQYLCESNFIDLIVDCMENGDGKELTRYAGLFITTLLTLSLPNDGAAPSTSTAAAAASDNDDTLIFEYKNRFLLTKAIDWLDQKEINEQLCLTAAVIIANYTRSDKDVNDLLNHEKKPHIRILNILKNKNYVTEGETSLALQKTNLIHSQLGAIRNFCIATNHRNELINFGVIESVLPYTKWSNLEVKYKAVGIIRLLVKSCKHDDELECLVNEELLRDLKSYAEGSEHPGLKGESSRLLTYLFQIYTKFKVNLIEPLLKTNSLQVVLEQLASNHIIMINEALLALNICITLDYGLCVSQLKENKLSDKLKQLFDKDQIPFEMNLNVFKLFSMLIQKGDFFTDEEIENFEKQLKSKSLNSEPRLQSLISSVLNLISKQN